MISRRGVIGGAAAVATAAAAPSYAATRRTLLAELIEYEHDPLGFVLDWFPWGDPGTLEHETGPDTWQTEILTLLGQGLLTAETAIRIAVASGHGVGKSALVSWIILWAFCTREDTRGVITANTETQLRTKTWAELGKWFNLFRARAIFKLTATAIFSRDVERSKTWRIDQVPWSEHNMEAFQGLHNKGKRLLLVFDEASAIPDPIWEVAEGALTDEDTEIIWCVFGNPTRNTGRFRECFGKFKHRWIKRQVDGRTCKTTNRAQYAEWLADYDEDSDFIRVRVRGVFPRVGDMQFISSELVEQAAKREPVSLISDPLVIGVDVARSETGDQTVIKPRKGRDAKTFKAVKLRTRDTMLIAARVADLARELRADAVFVDGGGVGGGVVDRLRQLKVPNVVEVLFGKPADRSMLSAGEADATRYANKRTEMWGYLRDWLPRGSIEEDPELHDDLTNVEYGYTGAGDDQLILEKKKSPRRVRLGLASPDNGDALALTFAYPVSPSQTAGGVHVPAQSSAVALGTTDFDPFDN